MKKKGLRRACPLAVKGPPSDYSHTAVCVLRGCERKGRIPLDRKRDRRTRQAKPTRSGQATQSATRSAPARISFLEPSVWPVKRVGSADGAAVRSISLTDRDYLPAGGSQPSATGWTTVVYEICHASSVGMSLEAQVAVWAELLDLHGKSKKA